jgi:lyso-ornithine lipid O-acyltransferase
VRGLRPAVLLVLFAALTLPLMPLQWAFVRWWPAMARAFPMYYHRAVARLLGIRINVVGRLATEGPTLLASNHVSWIDIVVLSAVVPLSFVAKREVRRWPFFGALAKLQRTVFVDRDRRHATGRSRDAMQERLKAGDTLVLFAEGTSSDGRRVLPFKSSFFAAAALPSVVVQPVTLAYAGQGNLPMTRRLMPLYAWYGDMDLAPHLWQALATGPVEVTVVLHPPLALSGEMNRKALSAHAEALVRQGLCDALHGRARIG